MIAHHVLQYFDLLLFAASFALGGVAGGLIAHRRNLHG